MITGNWHAKYVRAEDLIEGMRTGLMEINGFGQINTYCQHRHPGINTSLPMIPSKEGVIITFQYQTGILTF